MSRRECVPELPLPDAEVLTPELLERCQRRIGYQFRDAAVLASALTHASGADHRLSSNERLEFLGDAILGFVVCELLFQQFPDYLEGDLTKLKSMVVSRQTCAKISQAPGSASSLSSARA
jgi:ribonuclease-3